MKEDRDKIKTILSSFSCAKDPDIQNFLHNKAIDFELLSKARTYLFCDHEKMAKENQIFILGYITLAPKVLHLPDEMSIRQRQNLDGLSGKIHGEKITDIPCYLIGQLGRNDAASKGDISGKYLIDAAHSIILNAIKAVGGRYMMVECRNKPELIKFYEANKFEPVGKEPDLDVPMVQLICKIID